jgi:serine/threonine-protein kinase
MHKHRFDTVASINPEEVNVPPSVIHLVDTMMALNPAHRYQTPAQLLDAIKAVRAELEGKSVQRATGTKSVFVVESDARLQDAIRDRFKELGYKVFMAADPVRAHDRFRTQPYDAIVVDAGTTGDEGLTVFEQVLTDAVRQNLDCAGILLLNEDQSAWVDRVVERPKMAVLVRPVTLKQLHRKLQELAPTQKPA